MSEQVQNNTTTEEKFNRNFPGVTTGRQSVTKPFVANYGELEKRVLATLFLMPSNFHAETKDVIRLLQDLEARIIDVGVWTENSLPAVVEMREHLEKSTNQFVNLMAVFEGVLWRTSRNAAKADGT